MDPAYLRINQQLGNEKTYSQHLVTKPSACALPSNRTIPGFRPLEGIHSRFVTPFSKNQLSNGIPCPSSAPSLVPDRSQPVTVWRDPHLVTETEIRHIESLQHHTSFMAHHHGSNGGGSGGINPPSLPYQHHPAQPSIVASDGLLGTAVPSAQPNSHHQSRSPGHFVPSKSNESSMWRSRTYPTSSPVPSSNFVIEHNARDFRTDQDIRDTRSDVKKSTDLRTDEAVQQHFDESFRLAQQKRNWPATVQPGKYEEEQQQPRHLLSAAPTTNNPVDQRYFGMPVGSQIPITYNSSMGTQSSSNLSGKTDLPASSSPRVTTESTVKVSVDPKPVYNKVEAGNQRSRGAEQHQASSSLVQSGGGAGREQAFFLSGNHSKSSGFSYGSSLPRAKVSSPAPQQIYGKPGIPSSPNVPTGRNYDTHGDGVPLSLTSKTLTRTLEAPPLSSAAQCSLPKHEVRSADLAYYMYNPSSCGPNNYRLAASNQQTQNVEFQTQPLDLGGKRKPEKEAPPPHGLGPKKSKNEEAPSDRVINLTNYSSNNNSDSKSFIGSSINLTTSCSTESNNLNGITNVPSAGGSSLLSTNLITQTALASIPPTTSVTVSSSGNPPIHPQLMTMPSNSNNSSLPVNVRSVPVTLQSSTSSPPPSSNNNVVNSSLPAASNQTSSEGIAIKLEVSSPDATVSTARESTPPPVVSTSVTASKNSPSSFKGTASQVHKLKKAWLQRHSGEDSLSPGESLAKNSSKSSLTIKEQDKDAVSGSKLVGNPLYPRASKSINTSGCDKSLTPPPSGKGSNNNGQLNSAQSRSKSGKKGAGTKSAKKVDSRSKSPMVEDSSSVANGHSNPNKRASSSSASEENDDGKRAPKRKSPKKRQLNKEKKSPSPTDSVSDSDNVASDSYDEYGGGSKGKDSPSTSQPSTPQQVNKRGVKRGRKPRNESATSVGLGKNDRKKQNPFKRPPANLLKKTRESFLQDGPCSEAGPKLGKCRECRWSPANRSKKQTNIFCRFYAFRKLRYTKNGVLSIGGFSDPTKDPSKEDLSLWLPSKENLPKCLELDMSKFIISQLGDQFCELIQQEREALGIDMCQDEKKAIAWKRVVQGVREMCDVCDTTLFNYHWACGKCGFVVCIACYKGRKNNSVKVWTEPGKDRDDFQWLFCSNRQPHELDKLMLTQTIAGDCLHELGKSLHKMRQQWNIPQLCDCSEAQQCEPSKKETPAKMETTNGISKIKGEESSSSEDSDEDDEDAHSTLRELLVRAGSSKESEDVNPNANGTEPKINEGTNPTDENSVDDHSLKHFVRSNASKSYSRQLLPLLCMTLSESAELYPSVPHSWLCSGKLLRLAEPTNPGNYKLFQEMWKRGQPVIVANVDKKLNKSLWTPESFSRDFSELKNDLVNCMTGKTVPNQPMKKFWDGFDNVAKRLRDDKGNPMLLKLKDWPTGEDFAELLPSRFTDLMAALPLTEYTNRNGRLNLAARLPENFVRPDLGPKMYIAYGSGEHLEKGTTNLHLDISDAVNVLVHVGVPKDSDNTEHMRIVLEAIQDSDCDSLTIKKVSEKSELAGALWHIYNSRDADKIRDLLNKVSKERGLRLEPNHDPIHDQSWYLDRDLRKRLMAEYNVIGYPIVQCLGDAVFIPAGAPHQVRNLHNCIKIAEDFVSPENVSHCFDLTEEFRNLSDTHANHEDKLQIKNIIYHAVKDAISVLMYGPTDSISNT